MKKIGKILIYILGAFILVVAGLLTYVKTMLPSVGDPTDIKVELTAERIERGRYLANHVMVCMDCHSTRDWSLYAGPPIAGTEGKGGEVFDQKLGFPGKYISNNITPFNLGNWTDGEIFRAITTGVSKDGRALLNIMPYPNYGILDEDDIKSVIAYIRTLTPIEHNIEKSKSDFPMNFIINTLPQKAEFIPIPDKSDIVNYGKYLVTAATCYDCHTKQEKGKFVGEPYAGGFEFKFNDGSACYSTNITPHPTGIGDWDKDFFVEIFKMYADTSYTPEKVDPGQRQTVMPWSLYANMTTEDLEAMFAYLKTLKPVDNAVTAFTTAK
ncbi:MAG: cytochrome C [Bacteroidetes bacterium GWA2_40_15]|nr:MAG: cytochrome C [Bacteroidetes bacterium GWA2_40_15]